MTPAIFRRALSEGIMVKDPADPIGGWTHGEFTHAIQWLCISWQQKETNFLGCDAIEVYKHLGNDSAVIGNEYMESNIWNLLVDREEPTSAIQLDGEDFRDPMHFATFMKANEDPGLMCLANAIKERAEYRMTHNGLEKLQAKSLLAKTGMFKVVDEFHIPEDKKEAFQALMKQRKIHK